MQRGSDRLSVYRDDEMKHELQGLIRSGHATRVSEWFDPEPLAEDDPAVAAHPVPTGLRGEDALRFELARHLGRKVFPAKRSAVLRELTAQHAPDALADRVRALPADTTFHNVQEVVDTLRRRSA